MKFIVKPGHAHPCPKCGNTQLFEAVSTQVGEDLCEQWVECAKCGHCPTDENPLNRVESVMGGMDECEVASAFQTTWQELLQPINQ